MVNLKHALSAFAAVAMVGSLAANQASEITAVNAIEPSVKIDFNQPEILKNNEDLTVLDMFTPEPVKKKEAAEEQAANVIRKGYVLITEGMLNVLSAPYMEAETIAQLECAAEVIILEEADGWYQIQFNETSGYVPKEFITESYDEANAALLEHFKYESGYINADGVNIRDAAGAQGTKIIDQANTGDLIFVIENTGGDWLKVYYGKNYDVGYVMSRFVTLDDKVSKDDVAAAKVNRINEIAEDGVVVSGGSELNVRSQPDENSEVVAKLSDGEKVRIVSSGSNWTKIALGNEGQTAYVRTEFVMDSDAAAKAAEEKKAKEESAKKQEETRKAAENAASSNKTQSAKSEVKKEESKSSSNSGVSGQAIVNEAKKYIGTKYVYGGNSPSTGFDCSGLVQYVCRKVGISVNRSSSSQYSNGVAVSRANLQPGDLIFFSKGGGISHVVIYAGDGQVIHSPKPGKTVCYASLSEMCSYSNYVGARRVV